MAREFPQLIDISENQEISPDMDYEAYYHLEHGLMLALRESGMLNTVQYHLAEQELRSQRAERTRRIRRESE